MGAHYGFCDKKESLALRKLNSKFQGHPHVLDLPWVETSTGSLGQGFSVALGMAMGLRLQKSQARVYTLLGDGELQEGEVWEAAMCAAHHKLDNLCAIIDYNKLQSDDRNDNIMRLEPLAAKFTPSTGRWPRSTDTISKPSSNPSAAHRPRSAAPPSSSRIR